MPATASAESLNRFTSRVVQAAIDVHKALGPGLLESAYLGCLCFELSTNGLRIETQKALPLIYRGVRIDCAYRVDLIVAGQVIVEVKAMQSLSPIHTSSFIQISESLTAVLVCS